VEIDRQVHLLYPWARHLTVASTFEWLIDW